MCSLRHHCGSPVGSIGGSAQVQATGPESVTARSGTIRSRPTGPPRSVSPCRQQADGYNQRHQGTVVCERNTHGREETARRVEMPGGACKACQGNKCTKFSQQEAGAGFLFLGRLLSLSGDDKPSSGGGSKSGGASSGGSNSGSSMSNKQCKCGHTYAQHA
ncbi:uncharacterized protein LOC144911023 [Branchiostoma floridae x Branchiostoma belcheri]